MENNKKKIPALRFKGFEGEWEEKELGEVVSIWSGQDYKHLNRGTIPVYGTGGYMLSVNEALSYKKDAIGIGRKGTINKPYILKAPFWTVDTLFFCVPQKDYNLKFVYCLFQKIDWDKKNESTGVPSLSKENINNIKIHTGDKLEQAKIGNYFQNLDQLLDQHQQQLTKLQVLKKAMLDKMFPQAGESVPQIRFKGFEGEWEEKRLGELTKINQGLQIAISSRFTKPIDGGYFYITNEFLKADAKVEYYIMNPPESVLCDENDILMTRTGNTGEVVTGVNGAFHNNFFKIKFNANQISKNYLLYFLKSDKTQKLIQSLAGVSTIPDLNHNDFYQIIFSHPSFQEQQKIGNYFKNLDHLIDNHKQQLEKLEQIKKASLEQLFV